MLTFVNKDTLTGGAGSGPIRAGRKVRFLSCFSLVQDLLLAKKELRFRPGKARDEREPRHSQTWAYDEALGIDDLGYVQQSREKMEVLST